MSIGMLPAVAQRNVDRYLHQSACIFDKSGRNGRSAIVKAAEGFATYGMVEK